MISFLKAANPSDLLPSIINMSLAASQRKVEPFAKNLLEKCDYIFKCRTTAVYKEKPNRLINHENHSQLQISLIFADSQTVAQKV